jgi:hypothetical protein
MAGAGNHRHGHAFWRGEAGQVGGLKIPVPGRAQLVAPGQVEPELEAFHHPFFLLRNLGMDHASPGGHPLHTAVLQQAFVPGAVAVQHAPGDHVGHGFETAVRVVGKAGDVVVGLVAAKGVEHQKRVEPALQVLGEHPGELDAGTI